MDFEPVAQAIDSLAADRIIEQRFGKTGIYYKL